MEVEQDLAELAEKGSIGVVHSRTRIQSYQRMDGGSTYDGLNLSPRGGRSRSRSSDYDITDDIREKCGGIGAQGVGLLWLSVAGADIAPEELPAPMADDDRIRFWWLPSGAIEVVLGSFEDE